jgi:hypothetical protein
MTVARIFKYPSPGASAEMKVPSAVPVAKPLGNALTVDMYSRYSSDVAKSGSVVGVSPADVILKCVALVADDNDDADDDGFGMEENANVG